jgi:autotransporter-associated beta strand protein
MMRTLRTYSATMIVATSAIVVYLKNSPVFAVLIVGGDSNTTEPADDPGFANVGLSCTGGASVTYLGNGWCLTANHVTIGTFNSAYPNVTINGTQYQVTQVVSSPFNPADLKMFQINGDPGLAPLTIAATTPAAGAQVTMIGSGFGAASQLYWNVTVPSGWSGANPGTWTSTSAGGNVTQIPSNIYWSNAGMIPGTYQASGFGFNGGHSIRWGQNLITKSDQTDGATRMFYTTFNDPSYSNGQASLSSEAQAVNGDSGGGVFYKDPVAGWQLAGIMYARGIYPGQPSDTAVFGNISLIADLSWYRSTILGIGTPMSWTGQAGSTWDTASANWAGWNSTLGAVTATNAGGTYYAATFGDLNPLTNATVANAAITIQATGVTPPSLVFNNSTAVSYSFSNAAGGTGIGNSGGNPTAIIKNGTGSVTLSGSNSFTGPVYVNAGRLNLQNGGALGASYGVTVAAGAALELQNNISLPSTIPLTIAGTGFAGDAAGNTGALNNVSGNNTWAGPITLGSGGSIINSAAVGSTLTLSGAIGLGASSLTFSGNGNTSVTNAITGSGSVIKAGNGFLSLAAGNTYTGGTFVNGGVVNTGSLGSPNSAVIVDATSNGTTALVLGGQGANPTQWASSLSGSVGSGGAAVLSIGPNDTFTVNQATNTTFAGSLQNSGNFIKTGAGTLETDGAPTWSNNSTIQVSGGTLTFNLTSGTPTVGTGVTAMVTSSGGTLQLAGTVSALASPSYQVNVQNDSTAGSGGLYVTGTNQQVGAITGAGSTVVVAGASLTATSISQGALVIGGAAGSPGFVTIQTSGIGATTGPAASTSSSKSLTDSFLTYLSAGDFSMPFDAAAISPSATAFDFSRGPGSMTSAGSSFGSSVPEPSASMLAALAAMSASIIWFVARLYSVVIGRSTDLRS